MKCFVLGVLCMVASLFASEDPSSNEVIFSTIYETGGWDTEDGVKGTSGSGSSPKNAKIYIEFLKDFLTSKQIKSVVDLGCGDWQISQLIDWKGIQYKGVDVASNVIERNKMLYASENISFVRADGIDNVLPKADLLICKDVLQHLPFSDILSVITQLSKFKYCIIVNDVDPVTLTCENKDIPRGHYRLLDLTKPPFSLSGRKVLSYVSAKETKQVLLIENKYPIIENTNPN